MLKHFISIADYSRDEIENIFSLTKDLKEKTKKGEEHHLCKGKTMSLIFAKPSARTRISFETGMYQLGGYALYLSPNDIGIGKRESVADISRVISRYNNIIMARLFDHNHMKELAEYASVPVINGLTDYNHPCQIMADMYTILEHRGHLDDLKITYTESENLEGNLDDADVLYMTRIQRERFPDPEEYNRVKDAYQLRLSHLEKVKKNFKILHPMPRVNEIHTEVDSSEFAYYFEQAKNGVYTRQSIISILLGAVS